MSLITLFPPEEPRAKRSCGQRIQKGWLVIKQTASGFSGALLLSTAFHLFLAFLLTVTAVAYYPRSVAGNGEAGASGDLNLFARALDELTKEKGLDEELAGLMTELEEEKLPEAAQNFLILDEGLSEEEKIEIYKKLLENFFSQGNGGSAGGKSLAKENSRLGEEESFEIRSGEKVFLSPAASGSGKSELYLLSRDEAQELKKLEKAGALKNPPSFGPGHFIELRLGSGQTEVPAQYYYRPCPYEEIMAKGALNFSIIKGFPTFIFPAAENEQAKETLDQTSSQAERLFPQGNFRVFYYGEAEWQEQKAEERGQKKSGPVHFELVAPRWSEILDELMAYPEEVQFSIFEKDYLNKYDWNDPELVAFTKSFINSNLNGVIFIEDEFTAAFDALEELFYKKPIFERIAVLIESHPPSPVSDELLFCLASSLDMERRVIRNLARAYPQAKDIYVKKASLDYVFNSLPKAFVLNQVYEELKKSLSRKGYSSLDEALNKYLEAELKIYQELDRRGGRTGARALYALGLTYWEKGERERAIKTWREIKGVNLPASIIAIQRVIEETPAAKLDEEIEAELNYQSAKNSRFLYRRQVQFDKWARRQKVD
ncbi:MAG TPA: hypothetical protein DCW97_05945 [Acidobacteria bacterium]|nr:hypothetical protein [Acidobacteriota bacterium]